MSFQLPSFPRMRLVILIIGFCALFLFIGFVRWCFAGLDYSDPQNIVAPSGVYEAFNGNPSLLWYGVGTESSWWPTDSVWAVFINQSSITDVPFSGLPSTPPWTTYPGDQIWVISNDVAQPASAGGEFVIARIRVSQYVLNVQYAKVDFVSAPVCPNPEAEQAFLDSCPFGQGYYDCLEPVNSYCVDKLCKDITQSEIEAYCSDQGVDVSEGAGNNAYLDCTDDGQKITYFHVDCVDCDVKKISWANSNCNGVSNLLSYDCESNTGTCKPYGCDDVLAQCYDRCSGNVNNFSCDDISGTPVVSVPCDCVVSSPDIVDGTPSPSSDPTPTVPPSEPDSTTPDSPTTDPNSRISAENTKVIADILNQDLPAINRSIISNGAKLDTLNDTTLQSNEKLSDIHQDLQGTYSHETITNNYNIDSSLNTVSQFTTRFDSFVTDIKVTPLFSLPNQVLFNIPNSSESAYEIDMGQYGKQSIDFAQYAAPLLILRSAFLLCFCYAGLRIVVSKK